MWFCRTFFTSKIAINKWNQCRNRTVCWAASTKLEWKVSYYKPTTGKSLILRRNRPSRLAGLDKFRYLANPMAMKSPQICCIALALSIWAAGLRAQHFRNGSFELNDLECAYNLANASFDAHVPYVTALGTKSEMDMITDTCGYGPAFDGRDFVALYGGFYSDAIALELDEALEPGREYVLHFASKNGLGTGQEVGKLRVGFSEGNGLGNLWYESAPSGLDWTLQKLVFTADAPYRYVGISPEGDGWVFVDDFHFGCPELDLGNDTTICKVAGTILTSNAALDSYLWNSGATSPSIVADGPGLYTLEGLYDDCIVKDSILLSEFEHQCTCAVYVPNVFSPNGDGINDDFRPFSPCTLALFELLVFDRWGQLVFRTNDINSGWDGQIGHKAAPHGVYAYMLRYRFSYASDAALTKGAVLLIR